MCRLIVAGNEISIFFTNLKLWAIRFLIRKILPPFYTSVILIFSIVAVE